MGRSYALLRDEKASSTNGGTFTSGAWRTRDLNTESFDPSGIVSLSANQFTLGAGTYLIRARAPGAWVNAHQAKLYNVTDSVDALIGSSEYADNGTGGVNDSIVHGRITIATTKTFELRHQCQTTKTTSGFGWAANLGVVEVYTEVEIWKESVDAKISDLAAITSLDGTEEFVLADSGTSKKIAAADLLNAGELAYVEKTSDTTISATTEATANEVVSAGSVSFNGDPVWIEFYSAAIVPGTTSQSIIYILLYEDGASIGYLWQAVKDVDAGSGGLAGCLARYKITPSAGSHTYSINAFRAVSNGTVSGGPGGLNEWMPAYIRITRA